MKLIKNIAVGFGVSFIGSIPLGYLNFVGYHVHDDLGLESMVLYLLGIISVEFFVVYFTLVFAEKLSTKKKLMRYIELFSILFMFVLALLFYFGMNSGNDSGAVHYPDYSPFWLGVMLNCVNFVQLPFWIGWNLYLINSHYISPGKNLRLFYVGGTLAGTFAGMFLFVMFLDFIIGRSGGFANYILTYAIPLVFALLGLFQAFKYYKKYYRAGKARY